MNLVMLLSKTDFCSRRNPTVIKIQMAVTGENQVLLVETNQSLLDFAWF